VQVKNRELEGDVEVENKEIERDVDVHGNDEEMRDFKEPFQREY